MSLPVDGKNSTSREEGLSESMHVFALVPNEGPQIPTLF